MARKHSATLALGATDLTRLGSSVEINAYNEEGKMGCLEVGSGGIRWWPKWQQGGVYLSWSQFSEIMNERYQNPGGVLQPAA